jgi:hypothetical protein
MVSCGKKGKEKDDFDLYCNNCFKNVYESRFYVDEGPGFGSAELWAEIGDDPPVLMHYDFPSVGWIRDTDPSFPRIFEHICNNQHTLKTKPEYEYETIEMKKEDLPHIPGMRLEVSKCDGFTKICYTKET